MTETKTAASRRLSIRSWNGRWPSVLILLTCALALTSCRHGTTRTVAVPPEVLALTQPLERIPDDLRQPCPQQLPPAKDDKLPTLLRNHVEEVAPMYRECRDSKDALIQAVQAREQREDARIDAARRALNRQGKRLTR